MAKEKTYSRRLQSVIGGTLLKKFDEDCALRAMTESEGIREALREKYIDNDKKNSKGTSSQNPFFDKP